MSEGLRVLGVVVCDLERTAIGTRSLLADAWADGRNVMQTVVERLSQVAGVGEIVVLAPAAQRERVQALLAATRAKVMELVPRSAAADARVRVGRAWNLLAWRGGAGQWTVFDEEYHPAAIAAALAAANQETGDQGVAAANQEIRDPYEHVLVVHSHAVFLDVAITAALVQHHLHKNHEMRVTYTPAAPGLTGMVLRADIVREMGDKNVLPGQLLAYDPKAPTFDTLIREACMQVDPALSKVPNRFCVDTDRSWQVGRELLGQRFASTAEMCLAAAQGVAPGVEDLWRVYARPREVEIELTRRRLTMPAGSVSADGSGELAADAWVRFFGPWAETDDIVGVTPRDVCDDLLVTFGGLGDPLLVNGGVGGILRAAREAGALSICVQTDLAGGDVDGLIAAASEGLIDVVSVTLYGHTAATYAKVAGADLHGTVMRNLERLAEVSRRRGLPLMVPRLLKVRDTIPELEAFFDFWVERAGWAVIDYPTDRAGAVEFKGVMDMAPPKRRACRRIWDRMMVHADGRIGACDRMDVRGALCVGRVGKREEMWEPFLAWGTLGELRKKHAAGEWGTIDPCKNCREWHRA